MLPGDIVLPDYSRKHGSSVHPNHRNYAVPARPETLPVKPSSRSAPLGESVSPISPSDTRPLSLHFTLWRCFIPSVQGLAPHELHPIFLSRERHSLFKSHRQSRWFTEQPNYLRNLTLTLGASANFFEGTLVERDQLNPKVGLSWTPFSGTTLRAAAFRVLESGLSTAQTIEPTQVAGFNQFFGTTFEQDIENAGRQGFDAWRYGVAIDQKFSSSLYASAEFSKRDLRVQGTVDRESVTEDWDEYLGRAYLYWAPHPWLVANVEYQFERLEQGERLAAATKIRGLENHRVPMGINLFHPSGLSAGIKATFIDQSGLFFPSLNRPGSDQFWVIDATVRYRLPRRLGLITFGVSNLFDEEFNFREIDPTTPTVQRDRVIFGRVTLAF